MLFRRRLRDLRAGSDAPRGQSLVELALVLPLLLILLLGIADFGRFFAAGITIEASVRNGAEIAAIERLRTKPPDPAIDPAGFDAYYRGLHLLAAKTACSESRGLPNSTFNAASRTCPDMPVIRVCVRDGADPLCGEPISGFEDVPPGECTDLSASMSNSSGGTDGSHAVEVRACYLFTTLFNLHLSLPMKAGINVGDIWIQRERVFMVDCPPGDVSTC